MNATGPMRANLLNESLAFLKQREDPLVQDVGENVFTYEQGAFFEKIGPSKRGISLS